MLILRRNVEALLLDQESKPLTITRNLKYKSSDKTSWKKSLALDNRVSSFLILSFLLTLCKLRKYNKNPVFELVKHSMSGFRGQPV